MQEGKALGFASRTLSPAEQNYSQIEKEMLALTFGMQKFHHYTYGRDTTAITDHQPLIPIFNKPISKAPKRLGCPTGAPCGVHSGCRTVFKATTFFSGR